MAQQSATETRQLILEAAYKTFGRYGFDGTSIKTIAREAGLAPGSIYNHFTDKEELFESAVTMGWDQFIGEFRSIGESRISLKQKFETIIDVGFDLLKKAQPLLKGMFFGAHQRKLVQENLDLFMDAWEKIIIRQQQKGKAALLFSMQQRKAFIKYIVMGVLLAVAMVHPENADLEMERIKNEVKRLVNGKNKIPGGRK